MSRYLPRHPTDPDRVKRWVAFLRNHKDDIAAMDLFTVPTGGGGGGNRPGDAGGVGPSVTAGDARAALGCARGGEGSQPRGFVNHRIITPLRPAWPGRTARKSAQCPWRQHGGHVRLRDAAGHDGQGDRAAGRRHRATRQRPVMATATPPPRRRRRDRRPECRPSPRCLRGRRTRTSRRSTTKRDRRRSTASCTSSGR